MRRTIRRPGGPARPFSAARAAFPEGRPRSALYSANSCLVLTQSDGFAFSLPSSRGNSHASLCFKKSATEGQLNCGVGGASRCEEMSDCSKTAISGALSSQNATLCSAWPQNAFFTFEPDALYLAVLDALAQVEPAAPGAYGRLTRSLTWAPARWPGFCCLPAPAAGNRSTDRCCRVASFCKSRRLCQALPGFAPACERDHANAIIDLSRDRDPAVEREKSFTPD